MPLICMYAIEIILVLIGGKIPSMEPSYTMGIRTHWNLNNEENWRLTHIFGGKSFVLGGGLIIISAMLNLPRYIFLIVLVVACLAPVVYSAMIGNKNSLPRL